MLVEVRLGVCDGVFEGVTEGVSVGVGEDVWVVDGVPEGVPVLVWEDEVDAVLVSVCIGVGESVVERDALRVPEWVGVLVEV